MTTSSMVISASHGLPALPLLELTLPELPQLFAEQRRSYSNSSQASAAFSPTNPPFSCYFLLPSSLSLSFFTLCITHLPTLACALP